MGVKVEGELTVNVDVTVEVDVTVNVTLMIGVKVEVKVGVRVALNGWVIVLLLLGEAVELGLAVGVLDLVGIRVGVVGTQGPTGNPLVSL